MNQYRSARRRLSFSEAEISKLREASNNNLNNRGRLEIKAPSVVRQITPAQNDDAPNKDFITPEGAVNDDRFQDVHKTPRKNGTEEDDSDEDREFDKLLDLRIGTTKVVSRCEHDDQAQEDDLGLRGDPISVTSPSSKKMTGRLRAQIILSILFCVIEFVTGIASGSIALVADSYHMAADVFALIVAYVCLRMANKSTKSNSFGWVRMEAMGGFFNGLFLLTVCLNIFQEAGRRLLLPERMTQPLHVMIIGVVGLVINIVGLVLLNGHGHGHSHGGGGHGHSHGNGGHGHSHGGSGHGNAHKHKKKKNEQDNDCHSQLIDGNDSTEMPVISKNGTPATMERRFTGPGVPYAQNMASEILENGLEENEARTNKTKGTKNLNIHGVYLHLMSDAIGSIIVIVTASIVYFFPEWKYAPYFDPSLSICLALMMSFSAIGLVRESVSILLMRPPKRFDVEKIANDLTKIVGVVNVKDVNIWSLTGTRHIASANVIFCNPVVYADALFKIRKYFHDIGIHSVTVQPSFDMECMKNMRVGILDQNDAGSKSDSIDVYHPVAIDSLNEEVLHGSI